MTAANLAVAWRFVGAVTVTALGAAMVATALSAIPADAGAEVLASIVLPH